MPPPRKTFLLLIGLCLACPRPNFAWSRLGHEAVALIAEENAGDLTRLKLRALLGPNVGLDDIAACSDDIKRRSVNCGGAFFVKRAPHTKAWHYIDIPITANPAAGDLQDYCPQDDCVTARVADQVRALQDPKAARPDKQIALMHLVHFVGDLHQPLHCADDHDAGGNRKPVWFMMGPRAKKPSNLHHLWDNIIEKDSAAKKRNARDLARRLARDMAGKNTADWGKGNTQLWALESFAVARDTIYPRYEQDQGNNLGQDYQDDMKPIAEEQIQKAGVRLAVLLDRTLASVTLESLKPPARERRAPPVPAGQKPPKGGGGTVFPAPR